MSAQLRLFTGELAITGRESRQRYTLREAFERVTLPVLQRRRRSASTIAKYVKAVWYWELAYPHDPPICEITADLLDELPGTLLEPGRRLGITTNTAANQQQMYAEAILRSCGPRNGRRGGAGILDQFPVGERLPVQAPTKRRRFIDDEDWNRLYLACGKLTTPRDWTISIPFALASRVMLVLLYNCGPRRNEAMSLPTSSVIRTIEHPDDEIDVRSPHGWLSYHTPKTRSRKGGLPLTIPICETLRRHLDAIDGSRSRLFPHGSHPSTWRSWLRRLEMLAKTESHCTFQDMRKTANRGIRRVGGREVSMFVLGHQPRGVNATWYDDLTEDAVAAVNRRLQPELFERGPDI